MITFQINRSEIEGRIDPLYFFQEKELNKYKHFNLEKLKKFFYIKDGDHNSLPTESLSNRENGIRYLRAQDLKGNSIISEDPLYITKEYFETIKRSHIYPNDLLFSIMASIGSTVVVPENFGICTANRAIGIIRKKEGSTILPKYLQVLFNTNFGIKLLALQKRGGIQQRLNLEDVSNLEIPIFDIEKQKKLIAAYDLTILLRQRMVQELKKIIRSIDEYLLSELNVPLPQKDNSLTSRIFTTSFRNVIGNRIDPLANSPILESLRSNLSNSSFTYLKNIVTETKAIETEINPTDIYVGLENIESNTGKYIPTETKDSISSALRFKKGQILFPKLRPYLNKVYLAEFDGLCSTEFHVFDAKNIDVHFLHYCLLSKITLAQTSNLMTGNTLPRLQSSDIAHILIPNPPIEKQKEIAKHIQNIRNQAKQLETDAETKYKQAMQKIEQMIMKC